MIIGTDLNYDDWNMFLESEPIKLNLKKCECKGTYKTYLDKEERTHPRHNWKCECGHQFYGT